MAAEPSRPRFNSGNLFWGLLLTLIGTLFLLSNFNLVEIDLTRLFKLWPVLIIFAGISLLSLRGWVGATITGLLMLMLLGLVGLAAVGKIGGNEPARQDSISIDQSDRISEGSITIDAGAGRINIGSEQMEKLVTAELSSSFARLVQTSSTEGNTQHVNIRLGQDGPRIGHPGRNDLNVSVTESTPISLKVDAGAARIDADLSQVQLRRLLVDSGASNIDLRLGNRLPTSEIEFDVGMSSVRILVPENAGVSLRLDSGMSSRNIPGMRQVNENYYESDNYASAEKKINIRGQMGMTSFNLERY